MTDFTDFQQRSLQIQKQLQEQEVVSEIENAKVIMRGDQFVKAVYISGQLIPQLANAINDVIRQTQQLAGKALLIQ